MGMKNYIVLNDTRRAFSLNGWQNDHAKALIRKTEKSAKKILLQAVNFVNVGESVSLYSDYGGGDCKLVDKLIRMS